MKNRLVSFLLWGCSLLLFVHSQAISAEGKIKGNAGGIERGVSLFSRDGKLVSWSITGPSGLYEFSGIQPGLYYMLLDGAIVPNVPVLEGETTVADQATQPKLRFEKEVWGPSRVSFSQSFVAEGTAIEGFSLWRASGKGKLLVSLFEDAPGGKRVAGPYKTEKDMVWISSSALPADAFTTTPGKRYALQIRDAENKPWNCSMPRRGDVYPHGCAYFDGVRHSESDLGITIDQKKPGLHTVAAAREDLHYIAKGPGSGTCSSAGQSFIATTPNVIMAYANCGGWGGGVREFVFSIHEEGPGGGRIGPACSVKMVCNWGSDVVWFSDAVQLEPGRKYYLQYRRKDGGPFYSYLSKNVYGGGRAYRDGKLLPEQFDQLFSVRGEAEPGSVVYPFNVQVVNVTSNAATILWRTGNPADSFVHYGQTLNENRKTGDAAAREKRHSVTLENLAPAAVYWYRVSSHTHKQSSRRIFSRRYRFMTLPEGEDRPQFDKPIEPPDPPVCSRCLSLANPDFEDGVKGWKRSARCGRESEPERYQPKCKPFGSVSGGKNGYDPHTGGFLYGWSYFGGDDAGWSGPREDWKREVLYQRVSVEAGKEYVLSAWILTGDRGSGWGRDSRIRLAVDHNDAGLFERFETIDRAAVTQWFATLHQWKKVELRFRARADHVVIGAEFLQWWALEASHLYVDEFRLHRVQ